MDRIGPYRIVRKLGEGGMGIVYQAEDERLHRAVAIKTIRDAGDGSARERFLREARAAASLSHPNVCQLFDIGDEEGRPFLVMELLDGEPLTERLLRGALPLQEASQTALAILTALEALHSRGFVHRDLKPSNVFVTKHGVKLLDFGLAREAPLAATSDATTTPGARGGPLTKSGMIVGTPRYMAPEQLLSAPVDARTDLFAAGSLLFEMISGKPPFDEENTMRLLHAVVYENPPNLSGSAAITAINRIIHRAMAKRPEDRYASADAMAKDLRDVLLISDAASPVVARRITRLIALPLRILRGDPETDFLSFALPEAITTTLTGVGSLIVRSSAAAARIAEFDPKKLADEADVDVALTGTLLRAGDQIRVTSQLVELPSGAVIWSSSSQMAMAEIFELQDRLTQRIVESLQLPLNDREERLVKRDVPATPRAHEFYLRATQQPESPQGWNIARDLYRGALDEDPRYAPAWARLARIYLLLGKYAGDTEHNYELAESSARHALELNPDLPIAHHAFAHIAASKGRSMEAMTRLLDRVARGSNDPAVFSGLVTVLRFCGLLEASAKAHEFARQLDPKVATSATHTYWMLGRYEDALNADDQHRDFGNEALVYESMGRLDEALSTYELRRAALLDSDPRIISFFEAFYLALKRDAGAIELFRQRFDFPDPEGQCFMARALVRVGALELALDRLDHSEATGFFCYPFFASDPWLDPLRSDARFVDILKRAESRMRAASRAFEEHPASRVLGVG
jgi:serine/threonine protein kinase/tetratricopeptide (TPR) repeat protein